jgi:ATPase family associated with various cellular activities (AAA)
MPTDLQKNARDLELELSWFSRLLDARFRLYFDQEPACESVFDVEPPDLSGSDSPYARFLRHYGFSFAERTALVLALVPHVRPQLLDVFFTKNKLFDRRFTEFGGVRQGSDGDFVPTGETLAFLVACNDLENRFTLQSLFDGDHVFARHNILRPNASADEPPMKAPLRLSDECLSYFTTGQPRRPDFGASFPARFIETRLTWDDLVLHPGTRRQIDEIETWLEHGETLMNDWGMAPKLRPGYRSLFYGPPGTGKTMTACLLGKSTGRDVYKVDLSLVVSKYIGETEKNLARVFDQAQHKGWILFFDGIAILASNQRENLDDAFTRRFESIIYFPMPRPEERLLLWRRGFSPKARLDVAINLAKIAAEHTLAGGSIMNVIRYVSLETLGNGSDLVTLETLLHGIRHELAKEGRGI